MKYFRKFAILLWAGVVAFIFLGALNTNKFGFFSIQEKVDQKSIRREKTKIDLVLTAKHDFLGIITIRLPDPDFRKDDKLIFEIRRNLDATLIARETILISDIQKEAEFPIGLPPEALSKGQSYDIKMLVPDGNNTFAVSAPYLSAVYVFNKKEVDYKDLRLLVFIFEKMVSLFQRSTFWNMFFIFFVLFISPVLFFQKKPEPRSILTLILLLALLELNMDQRHFDSIYLTAGLLTAAVVWRFNIEKKLYLYLSLLFLLISIFFRVISLPHHYVHAFTWSYLFLIIFILDSVTSFLIRRPQRSKVAVASLLPRLEFFLNPAEWLLLLAVMQGKSEDETIRTLIELKILFFNIFRSMIVFVINIGIIYWIFRIIDDARGFIAAYNNYFPSNQLALYLEGTGKYLIPLYLLFLIVVVVLVIKFKTPIVTLLICALIMRIAAYIYDITSPFKYQVKIWSIVPNHTSEPWVDVTVSGENFSEKPFTGRVLIDGIEQRIIDWSPENVVFRTNPLTTRSGPLFLETFDGQKSDAVLFEYSGNR